MAAFNKKFMPNLAETMPLLYRMIPISTTRKTKLKWKEDEKEAFYRVKDRLSKYISLAHPIANAELRLYTDASQYAVGRYLVQIDPETKELLPLGVFSQGISAMNRQRSAFLREIFRATASIRHFAPYLHGRNFTLLTDNKVLYHACQNNCDNPIYSPSTLTQL